jgi:hypothetical protein
MVQRYLIESRVEKQKPGYTTHRRFAAYFILINAMFNLFKVCT